MSNWKRQVGMLNSMGRSTAKLNATADVQKLKAEQITRLVEQMKGLRNE